MQARRFVCGLNEILFSFLFSFNHPVWEQIQELFLLADSSCCEYATIVLQVSVEICCVNSVSLGADKLSSSIRSDVGNEMKNKRLPHKKEKNEWRPCHLFHHKCPRGPYLGSEMIMGKKSP